MPSHKPNQASLLGLSFPFLGFTSPDFPLKFSCYKIKSLPSHLSSQFPPSAPLETLHPVSLEDIYGLIWLPASMSFYFAEILPQAPSQISSNSPVPNWKSYLLLISEAARRNSLVLSDTHVNTWTDTLLDCTIDSYIIERTGWVWGTHKAVDSRLGIDGNLKILPRDGGIWEGRELRSFKGRHHTLPVWSLWSVIRT